MMTGDVISHVEGDYHFDPNVPLAFCHARHTEKVEGSEMVTQSWRMKERMKTVSVALVLCLNVGVDPPDVLKTSPCAKLECWIDPVALSPQKALETIGSNLQKQYERWQPRARYKQSLDPTVDELKKLCTSLRRNAKEERVLFHYNGHGVPRPTVNGEIWVFNKTYTQYIPLSVYDLQSWMGSPSIYVYDCSNAAIVIDSFRQFSIQRETEGAESANCTPPLNKGSSSSSSSQFSTKHCIHLAACGVNELLPMNPELPADLFTACLTTPIKIALKWYVLQNTSRLVPGLTQELVDNIPGQLNDRRTMLGELNWIFTAITDTIAWNTLPRELFQQLFRQDLLVASLFRNFLLAERIMRAYNCSPLSSPKLPPTYQHPMWQAWDLALDQCLCQLPALKSNSSTTFEHSPFFAEQLTAFQVWLTNGSENRSPPEQLPIVLQVLLSQVHRLRALDLLGSFLDLGPWAVSLALSVGIFPYVLKLLQSSARDLRPLLVFIWAKILAVDTSCQVDLVKDNGHKYFLSVLSDPYMPSDHRTMAAFVLTMIVNDYTQGQEAALQGNLIAICLDQLTDANENLRQWLALCLGKMWLSFDAARWCGVRDTAHEKLYKLLRDDNPEVRSAGVYALGTFISNSTERSDHANNIDLGVGMSLLGVFNDASPIVRQELLVALSGLVAQFETQFAAIAQQHMDEERQRDNNAPMITAVTPGGWNVISSAGAPDGYFTTPSSGIRKSASRTSLKGLITSPGHQLSTPAAPLLNYSTSSSLESSGGYMLEASSLLHSASNLSNIRRVSSSTSLSGSMAMPAAGALGFHSIYISVWKALLHLVSDACPNVSQRAKHMVNAVKLKATMMARPKKISKSSSLSHSTPSSPNTRPVHISENGLTDEPQERPTTQTPPSDRQQESPPKTSNSAMQQYSYSAQFSRSRKLFDKGPNMIDEHEADLIPYAKHIHPSTEFVRWCCKQFSQPVKRVPSSDDPEGMRTYQRKYRYMRNQIARDYARQETFSSGISRLDEQVFVNRNVNMPSVVTFHPYQSHLAVADKDGVSLWEWQQGTRISYLSNCNPKNTRITDLEYINAYDQALLMSTSDDGALRLWRHFGADSCEAELVTAFHALSDMIPLKRGSGVVVKWEPSSRMLLASGDVRYIRIWDTERESKVQDIPTGADSCVTSLTSDLQGGSLVIAGCGDGTVRLFDRRLSLAESRLMTLREHSGWVVKVHLQPATDGKIISASMSGDIRLWDPRFTESVLAYNVMPGLTCMEVHPEADIMACGSMNQYISVMRPSGRPISTIEYHEGFMGQRIGPINCLAFHPYMVRLAAGSTDCFVSVYSTPDIKKR